MITNADQQAIDYARQVAAAVDACDSEQLRAVYGDGAEGLPITAVVGGVLGRLSVFATELAGMVERREEKIAHLIGEVDHLRAELDRERDEYRAGAR